MFRSLANRNFEHSICFNMFQCSANGCTVKFNSLTNRMLFTSLFGFFCCFSGSLFELLAKASNMLCFRRPPLGSLNPRTSSNKGQHGQTKRKQMTRDGRGKKIGKGLSTVSAWPEASICWDPPPPTAKNNKIGGWGK